MRRKLFAVLIFALISACAVNQQAKFPPESPDGLLLVPNTRVAAVYMKPGAELSQYDRIALLDTYVSFAKNWQRDHNKDATFEDRVSDKDMQAIRTKVAAEFAKEFTRVLTADGRQFVTTGGTGVLILRPAIVNLQVNAPDLMTPGRSQTFVASAGSMTLYLELLDGKTVDLIARVIDPQAASDAGMGGIANAATNTADFDRIVRRWAQLLNSQLAQITRK